MKRISSHKEADEILRKFDRDFPRIVIASVVLTPTAWLLLWWLK